MGTIEFKYLFESAPGLYLILFPDFKIAAVSDAYLAATMTEREKIIGKGLFEVFPDNPDDPMATGESNLRFSLHVVLEKKESHTMAVQKYDIRRPDGSFEERFWSPLNKPVLNSKGEVIYIIHRVEDVTDFVHEQQEKAKQLKRAEDLRERVDAMEIEIFKRTQEIQETNNKLMETNRFINSILENIPNMIFVKDAKELRFVRFNKAGEELLGYKREDLIGKSDADFFPKEQADSFIEKDKEVLSQNKLFDIAEEKISTSSGERWLHTKKIPVTDTTGNPAFLLGISEDITERKNVSEKLIALNKELEAFTYSVSHDLRAPLRGINGYTRILLEDYGETMNEEAKRLMNNITENAKKMGQLIEDLLVFSRLGRKELVKMNIDMNELVNNICNELKATENNRKIDVRIKKLLPAWADNVSMKQVWANLFSNAMKYSKFKENAVIEIGSETDGREITYYIKDNGAGFDMRFADKLFGVFQRLHSDEEFEGTGVGLAIVQRIISKHEGRVWAEAKVNEGATFFFTLSKTKP